MQDKNISGKCQIAHFFGDETKMVRAWPRGSHFSAIFNGHGTFRLPFISVIKQLNLNSYEDYKKGHFLFKFQEDGIIKLFKR